MRRLQFLHEKIHLGSLHIDVVDLMHAPWTGWLLVTSPTLIGGYLVNKRLRSRNIEREEGTTRCCIYVVFGLLIQAMEEILDYQPFLHAMVWACLNVFLQTLPGLWDGLIPNC